MTHILAELSAALRAQADGMHASEAAAELLMTNASWLHRDDFLSQFMHTGTGLTSGILMAAIEWPEAIRALNAGRLPCSGGENHMLRIIASLADGIPVNLRDTLTGLDTANISRVATAVRHAGGQK
jgi:hypothetical protein